MKTLLIIPLKNVLTLGSHYKLHIKNPLLLKQHLAETVRVWLEAGLKQEVLEKVKNTVMAHFELIKVKENS